MVTSDLVNDREAVCRPGGHLVIFNSPERITALTPLYQDERFADGRRAYPTEFWSGCAKSPTTKPGV
jgi:hypothetical protein